MARAVVVGNAFLSSDALTATSNAGETEAPNRRVGIGGESVMFARELRRLTDDALR